MSEESLTNVDREAMKIVGVNIGALTVKVVALQGKDKRPAVMAHQGRPLAVLEKLLAEKDFAGADYFGVSGHLGHISEAMAIQRALCEVQTDFDAVVSLGGESFLVYIVVDGRISNVLSHNKCAAGSGEFFVQQIGRMGLGMDEAIQTSFNGKVVPLAARCSVHCKSDITHKLNRNEATPEDILHTLHDSMASKVIALLEKGQSEFRRVLLIGGVTRNAAMLAALREKLPSTEFVVLPESSWFEAWGSALLTRDEPRYSSPKIAVLTTLSHLPPLSLYGDRVQVIAAPPPQLPPDGPMVLGVDAGSTTTKAILLDPATQGVVASYYTRTKGDPVAATRECLRALVEQVGNRCVSLAGSTGSARELAGAYLGTEHVYNEISAHAAGAAHFDREVDTIFEIGGQDSKYIYLRNGVPIDYAMNNACSAGTGSFLEESAHGDLGIDVSEIASLALAAPAPVQFKATCAAFINSDIRIALQEGQTREDIVAGLVYAIAENYLNRVKGTRYVGKKVFLQGGVALNHAVGHAFAHSVGRDVVIPPSPELLGALGVALLAVQRARGSFCPATELLTLAAPEMKRTSRFTCRACTMYCSVDHFEVAGRRFPFGGRCSLYENVWKRKTRTAAAPDLVEQRSKLLFDRPKGDAHSNGKQIGIPKALTTHSLYPLYATFFAGLGMEVILSEVDPRGELKSNAGFCFPAQIAHGAVLDLVQRGVERIFLPHVMRMPQREAWKESYLCPITQASPYFLAKAYPQIHLLCPLLDFSEGYAACSTLVETAVNELGQTRESAERHWSAAVRAQTDAEGRLEQLGKAALELALAGNKPAMVLAGHSYNAFTPEGSQSVGKKLSSMGVAAIPADCLTAETAGPTSWHFANQVMNAVKIVKQQPNLFLLCVSNFSCTIDAFTQSMLASEMGSKPYLILEIDAHTADAGVQTRLEAFLDIVKNYREAQIRCSSEFNPARLIAGGRVIRGNGEQVPLTDPRVKLYFPNFSQFHAESLAMSVNWLGLHPGQVTPLDRRHLSRGLQYTSGRECLPLPICIGQLLEIHERRAPGEISGFYMLEGGAPCVIDAYMGYLERFIVEQRLDDLFLLVPGANNDHCGYDPLTLAKYTLPALLVADIMIEIEQVIHVVGDSHARTQMKQEWERFIAAATTLEQFHARLPDFVDRLASLPRKRNPLDCPRVLVTGDFFTRFSPFFMEGVRELYSEHGIILKPVELNGLLLYGAYNMVSEAAGGWGLKPGGAALAKACTRIFQPDGKEYLRRWLAYQTEKRAEAFYRKIFHKSGYLLTAQGDPAATFADASEHISPKIYGEVIPTVGDGVRAQVEGYDGIIIIGPFNCLPFRIAEAILKPLSIRRLMPLVTYESDGYAVSPSFLRQVEVHTQQVLQHRARNPIQDAA
ncbi:MAG: acyl-CoA dehydratase activase [Betaproteobacteria bacterium]